MSPIMTMHPPSPSAEKEDPVLPRAKSGLETEMRLCPNPEHTKTCDARQLEAGGRLRLAGRCSRGASRCQGLTAATVSPFTRQWMELTVV